MKLAPESRAQHTRFTRHSCQHLWLGPCMPGDSQPAAHVSAPSLVTRLCCGAGHSPQAPRPTRPRWAAVCCDREDGNLPVHLASFHQASEPSELVHVTRPVAFLICCDSYTEWLQVRLEAARCSVAPAAVGIWQPGIPALGHEGDCHCSHPSGEGLGQVGPSCMPSN